MEELNNNVMETMEEAKQEMELSVDNNVDELEEVMDEKSNVGTILLAGTALVQAAVGGYFIHKYFKNKKAKKSLESKIRKDLADAGFTEDEINDLLSKKAEENK